LLLFHLANLRNNVAHIKLKNGSGAPNHGRGKPV
jgi:hypothetical protein